MIINMVVPESKPVLYAITNNAQGDVTIDKTEAAVGETVTITPSDAGTVLVRGDLIHETYTVSAYVPVTFTMPACDVTVTAVIK